ncbi:hypothetical protein NV379_21525 [Paenibacillus sp. N1-5-1-14]|uniref:hypothetical protein n=1 Tax=Paenibacillus radicibacter TaxID=2972488 RepID=UPI0021594439|nr:hypothetical protein [Paenibacillus radicibacter]MCR8645240.1 hypothetical protein [Paenibacillus radicibacter]
MKRRIWVGGILACCMLGIMFMVFWKSENKAEELTPSTAVAATMEPLDVKTVAENTPQTQQEPQKQTQLTVPLQDKTNTAEFDYNQIPADKGVMVRLDSDPLLRGSFVSTLIAKRDETITFFFKEPMDRASVEKALLKPAEKESGYFTPRLEMKWVSDHELQVKAKVSEAKTQLRQTFRLSTLDAQTQHGVKLSSGLFLGTIWETSQIWQVSDDGSTKKQLTSFKVPYTIKSLDQTGTNYLLNRMMGYCECDRESFDYTRVYNAVTKKETAYPAEMRVEQSYRGSGSFIADRRGFFYALDSKIATEFPKADTAVVIKLPEFVHGATFSKDGRSVIAITGKQNQETDYTLRIIPLDQKGKDIVLSSQIKGKLPRHEGGGYLMPIEFIDDGKQAYFILRDENGSELRYAYDWSRRTVGAWKAPIDPNFWAGFKASSDGRFRYYANGGLYDGEKQLSKSSPDYEGIWAPNTHEFVFNNLSKLNAETMKVTSNNKVKLPSDTGLLTISNDAKWYFLSTPGQIK